MAGKRAILAALMVVTTAACAVGVPYGEDPAAKQKSQATSAASATAAGDAERPRADSPAAAAATDTPFTAPLPCGPQNVTWTVDTASCAATLDTVLQPGVTLTLTDTTGDATGKVTVACEDGKVAITASTCELPKQFDVGTNTGCINGYCAAATSGKCGVPDANRATAFCVFKGYTKHIDFKTMPGPNGARQCAPDGQGCFTNANPGCNIVFSSVTCVR
jgi:hypothetical protein